MIMLQELQGDKERILPMKSMKFIKHTLKKELTKDRYQHTVRVAYTAMCLAMRYETELEQAQIAAYLHDCAKCIPNDVKIKECKKKNIVLSKEELEYPELIHAKLGAIVAKEDYEVEDLEILSAIEKHTTGAPDMTMLEKIIYVADYIEPGRYKAENLKQIRSMAFQDIDRAVYMIMNDTLTYLEKKGGTLDSKTRDAYEFYRNLCINQKDGGNL